MLLFPSLEFVHHILLWWNFFVLQLILSFVGVVPLIAVVHYRFHFLFFVFHYNYFVLVALFGIPFVGDDVFQFVHVPFHLPVLFVLDQAQLVHNMLVFLLLSFVALIQSDIYNQKALFDHSFPHTRLLILLVQLVFLFL